jgi:hypothetical protein
MPRLKKDEHKWAFVERVFPEKFLIHRRAKDSQSSG